MTGGCEISLAHGQDDGVSCLQCIGHLLFHQRQFLNLQAQLFPALADQCPGRTVTFGIIAVFLGEFRNRRRMHGLISRQIVTDHGKAGGSAAGNRQIAAAVFLITPIPIPL